MRNMTVRVVGVMAVALGLLGCSSSDDGAEEGEDGERATEASAPVEVAAGEPGFFEPPEPLPDGDHGDLMRYQAVGGAPEGVTWYRVMYLSESVVGEAIAVTGMVVVPDGEAPAGGWPVVSHAHGGNGVGDDCAPSRAIETDSLVTAELEVVSAMAGTSGYVVASTDYEGLGGPAEHPFLVGESEGRGVLDIALAVRQLPGIEVGPTTAIAGYSQGGHAALWAHQLAEEWTPELEIVGTMAGAPASEIADLLGGGEQLLWVPFTSGMAAAYPDADPADILTPAGLDVLDQYRSSCGVPLEPNAGDVLFKEEPTETEPWAGLLADYTPGSASAPWPVLLIHSAQDANVPVEHSATLLARQCAAGQVVERRVLPEGDHVVAAVEAYRQAFAWFDTLAAGTEPTSSCS